MVEKEIVEKKESLVNFTDIDDIGMEEFSTQMSILLTKKLQKEVDKILDKLTKIKKSKHKNKSIIVSKYEESVNLLSQIIIQTKEINKLQRKMIEMTEKRGALEEEIEKLLLN